MKSWANKRLGDVLTFQRGFDITKNEQSEGTVPIVSSSGISSYHNKYKVSGPGVVTGRKGTLGKVHYILENHWPHDTTLWIKDFKGNLPRFIYYYLSIMRLENYDVGASNPTLNRNHLHKLKILWPLPHIQRKIAAILSAYDELIENNNRRIAILEKMAEEIYREWFVRLRFPGHKKVKVVKGVPEGWEVKKVGEVIKNYIGGGWGEENQNISHPTGAYVIRGTDIPALRAGKFDLPPFRYHKNSNFNSRAMKPGDIVFEVSGGSKDQLLGRSLLITSGIFNLCKGKVICASFCKMIRPSTSSFFLKYFLQAYYKCGAVGTYQIQSTGISNYQFESFVKYQTIILPTSDLLSQFDKAIFPLNSEKDNLAQKNSLLTESRDLLLPRLISGKLDVENLDIAFPPGMEEDRK